ncbi:MAG: helix-turn-helix domain-containing protein [Verrucomicrobiae bacterium]|nr:helix-turn-helix domain-containing protein [Verrucomicrobiae bacterium]
MQKVVQLSIEEAFGVVLRKRRKKLRLTQTGLSIKSRLSKNFISLCERGQQQPSLNSLFLLARALKTEPVDIVAEVQNLNPRPNF